MTTTAVLTHGFLGDRTVWHEIAPALEERGVRVERVLLPGHEDDAPNLGAVTADDWVGATVGALRRACDESDRVLAVGFSLGTLTTCHGIAAGLVDRAVLISPPALTAKEEWVAMIDGMIADGHRELDRALFAPDAEDQTPLPLTALRTTFDLFGSTSGLDLTGACPARLLAGSRDDMVGAGVALQMLNKFPPGTELVTYAGADHDLPRGPLAAAVTRAVVDFLLAE